MKKFKFSLEKVLVQREILKNIAQKDFSEAEQAMRVEKEKLQEMIDLKEKNLIDRAQIIENTTDWSNKVEQINQFLNGQDQRIKNQNQRLLEAENLVESRREILRQAVSEVKILERLKEKKLQEHMQVAAKQEQSELDELAVMRFSRIENPIKGSHEDGI